MKKYLNTPAKASEILSPEINKFSKAFGDIAVIAKPLPLFNVDMDKLKSADNFDSVIKQNGFVYFIMEEKTGSVIGISTIKINNLGDWEFDSCVFDKTTWSSVYTLLREVFDYCEIVSPFAGTYAVLLRNKKEKIENVYTSGQYAGSIDLKEYVRQLKSFGKSVEEDKKGKLIKVLSDKKKKNYHKKAVA